MSRIKQAESLSAPESRNSSAEANEATSRPAAVMTRYNIRDMDRSSSTTEIKGFVGGTLVFSLIRLRVYQLPSRVKIVPGFREPVPKYNRYVTPPACLS